jgi:hypothetical protein
MSDATWVYVHDVPNPSYVVDMGKAFKEMFLNSWHEDRYTTPIVEVVPVYVKTKRKKKGGTQKWVKRKK